VEKERFPQHKVNRFPPLNQDQVSLWFGEGDLIICPRMLFLGHQDKAFRSGRGDEAAILIGRTTISKDQSCREAKCRGNEMAGISNREREGEVSHYETPSLARS
jgi:hypothetical protein